MSTEKQCENRLVGKMILSGKLRTTSPLLIGKGKGDLADTEVMTWTDGKPYIPGSSLGGALRARFIDKSKTDGEISSGDYFWGTKVLKTPGGQIIDNTSQSHLLIDDVRVSQGSQIPDIVIRDGVKINPETGIAEDTKKYDYQLVDPGVDFDFRMELSLRKVMDNGEMLTILKWLAETLKSDDFRIGALSTTGFGRFELTECRATNFDFRREAHRDAWFEYLLDQQNIEKAEQLFELKDFSGLSSSKNTFRITATFKLKSALLTGSYSLNPDEPDKVQLKSNNKFVLSGKAIKGAIRHRALMILNTIGVPNAEEHIRNLMGYVSEDGAYSAENRKSKVYVEETILQQAVNAQTQDRIKIDRFTGGTVEGAKFESMPVWRNSDGTFSIILTLLDYETWQASLLLHILKDLGAGDLAIGGEKNVGRGVLEGVSATIEFDDQKVQLDAGTGEYEIIGDLNGLSKFNNALSELVEETVNH